MVLLLGRLIRWVLIAYIVLLQALTMLTYPWLDRDKVVPALKMKMMGLSEYVVLQL